MPANVHIRGARPKLQPDRPTMTEPIKPAGQDTPPPRINADPSVPHSGNGSDRGRISETLPTNTGTNQSVKDPSDPPQDLDLPSMPTDADEIPELELPTGPPVIGPPPSFGRQMAQLVIIPAAIVLVCLGLATLFGTIAGAKDSLENHLLKLRQSSGGGRMKLGFQDPRYKDRGLAAYNIATMIPTITDTVQRQRVSDELIDILDHHVSDDEHVLAMYLLLAIGQLGQDGGLEAIIQRLHATESKAREGAVGAILSWPNTDQARLAIDGLRACLTDESPIVRAEAAAALGQLANPSDHLVIESLCQAMTITDLTHREGQWNAAVALTRLDDDSGVRFVSEVLLNRQALLQMPAGESGQAAQSTMPGPMVDRVMISTLSAMMTVNSQPIWDKIKQIADHDPSGPVRMAATKVFQSHPR